MGTTVDTGACETVVALEREDLPAHKSHLSSLVGQVHLQAMRFEPVSDSCQIRYIGGFDSDLSELSAPR